MHEFFIGYWSNMIPTYLFYPLDTMMVRRQTKCAKTSSLYRGVHRAAQMNGVINGFISTIYFGHVHTDGETLFSNVSAGIVAGMLTHPIENRKIFQQTFSNQKSLLRGLPLSLVREALAVPIYFKTYTALKSNQKEAETRLHHFVWGGVAGVHSWIWSYPLSTIRARFITRQEVSFSLHAFYRGFGFCAIRSFFLNGTCFMIRETLNKTQQGT